MSDAEPSKTKAPGPGQSPTTHDLTDQSLGRFTGYLLKRAFNVVHDDLTTVLEPFGLRMLSFSALLVVVEKPDITQTALAQALAIERSNLVVLLDGLELAGHLTRNPVPNNRRAYALRATLAGHRLAAKALKAVEAHEARLFAGFAPEELARLRAALMRVAR